MCSIKNIEILSVSHNNLIWCSSRTVLEREREKERERGREREGERVTKKEEGKVSITNHYLIISTLDYNNMYMVAYFLINGLTLGFIQVNRKCNRSIWS